MKDINYLHINMEQKKPELKDEEKIIRIMSRDMGGSINIYAGLTKIKGVSWSFSNAVCKILKIEKTKKIGSLSKDEIKNITDFIKNPKLPKYLVNRNVDFETGENKHLTGSEIGRASCRERV